MSDFERGLLVSFVLGVLLFCAAGFGIEAEKRNISDDCIHYGKTMIKGKLYECKPK